MKMLRHMLAGVAVAALPGVALADGISFTSFSAERDYALNSLGCTWVSQGGVETSHRGSRYDFLCKGGTWATVNLFFNKTGTNGLESARLVFRQWDVAVHPAGGEAHVAQKYLQHVLDHLVPSNLSSEVADSFWGSRARKWRGAGVDIAFDKKAGEGFDLRELTVTANGTRATRPEPKPQPLPPVSAKPLKTRNTMVEWGVPADAPDLVQPSPVVAPVVVPPSEPIQLAPISDTPLPPLPVVLPVPQPNKPVVPGELALPPELKDAQKTLQPANPAEFSPMPEPESIRKDVPPVPVSTSLVPEARVQPSRAPSNFEMYNKASELTRKFEEKALTKPGERNIINTQPASPTATPVQQGSGLTAPAAVPSVTVVPSSSVPPLQQPVEQPQLSPQPAVQPQAEIPSGEGLGSPSSTPASAPAEPRFTPERELPQLKFIPKAKPLDGVNEVIEFEDEKSSL